MPLPQQEFSNQDETLEENQRVRRLLLRIIPFWPLILLFLTLSLLGGYIYLRYQIPLYVVNAKIVVNDDSQEKSANLVEIFKLDTRNLSVEAEREMEILSSRDLLGRVVSNLQLNVQYTQKGFVKSGQFFKNIPVKLELEKPDSIEANIYGEVKIVENKINYKGVLYAVDSLLPSIFGKIKWHINKDYTPSSKNDKWFITILPLRGAVDIIQRDLTLKPISKQSSIIQLSYVEAIPERGIEILNKLIELYGSTTVDYKSRISENTLSFLDARLRLVAEELNEAEKNLQTFKTKQRIMDLGVEGSLFLSQVKETDAKISELNIKMEVLNKIEQYVTRRNNTDSQIPATLGTEDPVLISLLNQLYQTEFDLEKIKKVSGIKNPQIVVYEEAIAKLKPSIISSINNLKMNIQVSLQHLQTTNNNITATLQNIPLKERLLIDISRQGIIKNTIYNFLLQKKEESAIAAAAIVPNYRVIEKPEFAGLVYPVSGKIYGNAILFALLAIAFFIYFNEFATDRIKFRSQIESVLPNVPIIGELIFQPQSTNTPIVTGDGKRTLIAEQFRELRTNLNYVGATTNDKCKVILLTSSITEEGKSFVAINTAITLTLTGVKVVLLDFDMRKPKISKQLNISSEHGLSNYLINMANETDIIKPHPAINNFSIITSGPIPPNPAELIGVPRLLILMEYLKQHFDYILIDSPPISVVTDAKLLAKIAHATIYIIRFNYTDRSYLRLIKESYQKHSLPNINLVFNGLKTKKILGYTYGKGYGYGYAYGYGYGENKKTAWWKRLFFTKKLS